jgi:hypothetical protein
MILAHAFGARYDLPIPLALFVIGGGVVVLISFMLVARRTSADDAPVSDSAQTPDQATFHPIAGTIGLVVLAFLVWVGFTGAQSLSENMLPTSFWLLTWIAVPLSCGLFGDWTRPVNPFASLAKLADRPALRKALLGSAEPVSWPRWLGCWPAVVVFFLTACGELVFNVTLTIPHNTALALVIYAFVSAAGGLLFGDNWLRNGEMFSVLFATWGRLGYWRFGAPGRRGFAGGLEQPFDASPSRISFTLLLLISVNFDGLLATPSWSHLEDRLPGGLPTHPGRLETFRLLTFLALAVAIAILFGAFAAASARAGRQRISAAGGLANLLPSLVPIAFGYLLVHNLQYLVVNSQLMLPLIGNPVGKESWPLHLPYPFNDSYEVNRTTPSSSFYWYTGVAVIIVVHVIAVLIAHRRLAHTEISADNARRTEYPWLAAMAGYTMLSLWLIAQPLVKEGSAQAPEPSAAAVNSQAATAGR